MNGPIGDAVRGAPVQVAFTKADGTLHWHVSTRYLGRDEHGTWLHAAAGTFKWRPGRSLTLEHASVVCLPEGQHWVATLYDQPITADEVSIYVDIATPARWTPGGVTMVDLDLDVVRCTGRAPFVDDEDEFTEHTEAYRYPETLVRAARQSCAQLLTALTEASAPFDGATARRWLDRADPAWLPSPPPAAE